MNSHPNSFNALDTLRAGDRSYAYFRLAALEESGITKLSQLPFSLKILLENLLRCEDGVSVSKEDIEALARYDGGPRKEREIAFSPARVLLQDFTGVPCVVDLAAMRDAMAEMRGDPAKINPLQPVELVIDHSVQVDYFGSNGSLEKNTDLEFERNRERYAFLKWGQSALSGLRVVPPGTGIVHQVNIEYLARVVFGASGETSAALAYPDTAVGTDSHTTMVNGLGVLAWGVGGIEAEAAMLGQPVTMLIPQVVGFRLEGALREGVTATDLVLTVAEMLRRKGVVGKFVEFYGRGLSALPVVDRTTISKCRRSSARPLQSSRSTTVRWSICVSPGVRRRKSISWKPTLRRKVCFAPMRRRIPSSPIRLCSTSVPSSQVLPGRPGHKIASRYATSSVTSGGRQRVDRLARAQRCDRALRG